jgi:hypothetical protein
MFGAHKKVIVRRSRGEILHGYLATNGFLRREPSAVPVLDLLDPAGRVIPLPLDEVKMVSYVRDFNLQDLTNPERLGRRSFLARPRTEGLWVRLLSHSGEPLEGLAPRNLDLLTGAIEDLGLHLIPPDIRSNTQRLFVPRTALADLQILAVVTTPSRKRLVPDRGPATLQNPLFPSSLAPDFN